MGLLTFLNKKACIMWTPVVRKKSTAKRTAAANVGQLCHTTLSSLMKSTPSHEDIVEVFTVNLCKLERVSKDGSIFTI